MKKQLLAVLGLLFLTAGIVYAATISEAILAKFAAEERQYQLPTGVLAKIARAESSGNACLSNPSSTAVGIFQWLARSWVDATRALYGAPKNLDARCNPLIATEVTAYVLAQFRNGNRALIQQAKAEEMPALYLAHFLGPAGARKHLQLMISNPNDSAAQWFPREARSNPTVFNGRTIVGLYNWSAQKMQAPGITGVTNYAGTYDGPLTGRIMDPAGDTALNRVFSGALPPQSNAFSYPSTYTAADLNPPTQPLPAPTTPVQGGAQTQAQTGGNQAASQDPLLIIVQRATGQSVLVSWTSVAMRQGSCTVRKDGVAFANGSEGTRLDATPGTSYTLSCTAASGAVAESTASGSI